MIYKRLYTLIATLVASTALLMVLGFSAESHIVSAERAALPPANLFSQPTGQYITVTVVPTTGLHVGDVMTVTVDSPLRNVYFLPAWVDINGKRVFSATVSPNQPFPAITYTVKFAGPQYITALMTVPNPFIGVQTDSTIVTATATTPVVDIAPIRLDNWKLNDLVTLTLHLTDENVTGVTRTLTVTVNGDNPKLVTITGTTVTTRLPVTLTEYGDNPLTVQVTNQYGLTDTDTITFKTEAYTPTLEVTYTTPPEGFKVGDSVMLTVTVTDINHLAISHPVTVTVNGDNYPLWITHTGGTALLPVRITIPVTLTQEGVNPFTVTVTNRYGLSATEMVTITAPTPTTIYLPIVMRDASLSLIFNGKFDEPFSPKWQSNGALSVTIANNITGGLLAGNVALLGNPGYPAGQIPVGFAELKQDLFIDASQSVLAFDYKMETEGIIQFKTGRYSDSFELYLLEDGESLSSEGVEDAARTVPCLDQKGTPQSSGVLVFCQGRKTVSEPESIESNAKIDVTRFAGKKITLVFRVYNRIDSRFNVWVAIDNVRLEPK